MNIKVPKFILDIFNKIFKKKKEEIAQIIVKVPTRDELIENKETDKLVSVDNYKREYENKLSKRQLFNSISSKKLQEDFIDNQNIILNHIRSNNYNSVDALLANGTPSELLEVKLEYLKLYMLNQDNSRLYEETLYRYMAISELKEQFFMRPSKRSAIKNEYDYLYSSLIIYASNNFATNSGGKLYLIRMNSIKNHLNELNNREEELLNNRKNLLIKLANMFIKDKLDNVLNSNINDMMLVSYLEIELEKYYNKNKQNYNVLIIELNKIKKKYNKYNRNSLLKEIEKLELKYIFNFKYGNNITKKMFEDLYETKFNILTCDMDIFGDCPISKDDYGYRFYKVIIAKKVYDIINGKNIYFNNTFHNIEKVKTVFKKEFQDLNKVMSAKYLLITLLSFDKEDGFNEMLDNTIISKNDLKKVSLFWPKDWINTYKKLFLNDKESMFIWDDNIPLSSVLNVAEVHNIIDRNSLLSVLHASGKNCSSSIYKFPEGVAEVDFDFGCLFYRYLPCEYLTIPTTLTKIKNIPFSHFPNETIYLVFEDFRNSLFLNDKESVTNLIREACKIDHRLGKREAYHSWIEGTVYETVHEYYYKLRNFNICIKDNGELITITCGEKVFIDYYHYPCNEKTLYKYCEKKAESIRDIIYDKVGYDIFNEKKLVKK